MSQPLPPIASPCIGVCRLDAAQVCTGCYRSIDEIVQWPGANPARKRAIVAAAKLRENAAQADDRDTL